MVKVAPHTLAHRMHAHLVPVADVAAPPLVGPCSTGGITILPSGRLLGRVAVDGGEQMCGVEGEGWGADLKERHVRGEELRLGPHEREGN